MQRPGNQGFRVILYLGQPVAGARVEAFHAWAALTARSGPSHGSRLPEDLAKRAKEPQELKEIAEEERAAKLKQMFKMGAE